MSKPSLTPLMAIALAFSIALHAPAQSPQRAIIGTEATSADSTVKITLIHKLQHVNAADKATYDTDITSPKSVNIHPDGSKFYVNSLEGCVTVVYEMDTWKKLKVISHHFDATRHGLWAKPSGLFPFTHYSADTRDLNSFDGKPVESTFSHHGRYLWVPYYRRSYDINAQDPSAMAVIYTRTDEIIRMFETGPLPKMVACSNDGKHIAVSHWGNNTVGILNIDSPNPEDWHYEKMHIIDYQLELNFSLTTSVDRDSNTGYALRGTVFTPDDHYLLVGCMGGGGGIAVIDMEKQEYLGRLHGMRANIRHLIIKDGWLYMSSNSGGVVQRIRLDRFIEAAQTLNGKTAHVSGFEECAVMTGARTIEASPSGRFIFAACNNASQLCVVDTRQMRMVTHTTADSYPVGLAISDDGAIVITTSQGRKDHGGGNAVNIFRVDYAEPEPAPQPYVGEEQQGQEQEQQDNPGMTNDDATADSLQPTQAERQADDNWPWYAAGGAALLIVMLIIALITKRHRKP